MFIEGDSVVGIEAKELFDFFDDLLDVDPGLDDSDLVEVYRLFLEHSVSLLAHEDCSLLECPDS